MRCNIHRLMQRLQYPGDCPKCLDSHLSSSEFKELLNPNFSVHPSNFSSLMLFGLSLCNYTLMYWANIFLARHLSVNAFDDFNVAVSVVTLLSTFATLGLEKYALRLVALYMERENWPRLLGFWKFSLATILLFSFVLMGLTNVGLTIVLAWHNAESHTATLLYTLFLPAIALRLYLTEAITVFGAQILALVLYRLVLPTVFFLLIIVLHGRQAEMTAEAVMICLGSAWVLTLFMMLLAAHAASPKAINQVKADYHGKRWWLKNSLPLIGLLSLAAISTLVLGYSLGSTYGATGMAIAYALPTITLFSSLKWLSRRHMMQFIAG